jgi:hypothetical protein
MPFVALDQGNRLDWLLSGFIMSLLTGLGVLVVALLLHKNPVKEPWRISIFTRDIALDFLAVISLMVARLSDPASCLFTIGARHPGSVSRAAGEAECLLQLLALLPLGVADEPVVDFQV